MGRPFKRVEGQRFGRLIAIAPIRLISNRTFGWACKCDCGTIHYIGSTNLLSGNVTSCGCYRREEGFYTMKARAGVARNLKLNKE